MNAVEMRSLRTICGVSLADRIRNEEIHRMAGTNEDVTVRMKKNVLSWLGHVERMSDERKRSRKKHEDPPEGMYEEVDDSGRGKRGM